MLFTAIISENYRTGGESFMYIAVTNFLSWLLIPVAVFFCELFFWVVFHFFRSRVNTRIKRLLTLCRYRLRAYDNLYPKS